MVGARLCVKKREKKKKRDLFNFFFFLERTHAFCAIVYLRVRLRGCVLGRLCASFLLCWCDFMCACVLCVLCMYVCVVRVCAFV